MLSRYLAGAALARTGDELSGPALLLLGLTVTGSPVVAATLLAGLTASAAVGGPMFGALLDRTHRPGRLLATALAAYAVGLAAVLASVGHLPTPVVLTLAVLAGLFNPAVAGGWTSQLPIGRHPPQRAMALDAMTFSVASLVGPALAALVADRLGAPTAVATAVGLVVLACPSAWSLPRRAVTTRKQSWTAGFRVFAQRRRLLRATVTSTISYVGVGMTTVCYPLVGTERLGGASRGALLLAVLAAAALATNAFVARRPWRGTPDRIDRMVLVSTLVLAASAALSALPGFVVVGTAALAGMAEGPQLTALFAVRHREAPEHLRAQVFTTGASLKITGFAAGAALAGPLAAGSLTGCLLTAGAVQVLAAASYAAIRTPSPARAA